MAHVLNPGDVPTRILEIISPAGLEEFFRELGAPEGRFDVATLPALAARYGADVDFERTLAIVERHRLKFLGAFMLAGRGRRKSSRRCWKTRSCFAVRSDRSSGPRHRGERLARSQRDSDTK